MQAIGGRRSWGQLLASGLVVCGLVGVMERVAQAAARTYSITTNTMALTDSNVCTLRGAVRAVNTRAAVGKCGAPGGSASSPDIINITGGLKFTFTSKLDIKESVTIRSTNSTKVVFQQVGLPQTSIGGTLVNVVTFDTARTTKVTFQDISMQGAFLGSTLGLYAEGKDPDRVLLTRSLVEQFDFGGVHSKGTSLVIESSGINENSHSESTGAGIFIEGDNSSTTLQLYNSSVTKNFDRAGGCNGGGIFMELNGGSFSAIRNSTISDNRGGAGIALFPDVATPVSSTLEIDGSTIAFNKGAASEGCDGVGVRSICAETGSGACVSFDVILDGTIVAANESQFGDPVDFFGPVFMVNSIIGSSDGTRFQFLNGNNRVDTLVNLDPVLRDNGLSGQHRGSHKPLQGSIAIDFIQSIDYGTLPGVNNRDQRGKTRPFDFVSGGNKFDVGAVELQSGE